MLARCFQVFYITWMLSAYWIGYYHTIKYYCTIAFIWGETCMSNNFLWLNSQGFSSLKNCCLLRWFLKLAIWSKWRSSDNWNFVFRYKDGKSVSWCAMHIVRNLEVCVLPLFWLSLIFHFNCGNLKANVSNFLLVLGSHIDFSPSDFSFINKVFQTFFS